MKKGYKQTEVGVIPVEWTVTKLEEIASVERGRFSVRPRNDPRYYGGSIPFVQTGDISNSFGWVEKHSQTLNELGRSVSKVFPPSTILVTIAANIGDFALTRYEVACPDSLVGIIPHDGYNPYWLKSYLTTQKEFLESKATQNAQKNINLQTLKPLLIPLPPSPNKRKSPKS